MYVKNGFSIVFVEKNPGSRDGICDPFETSASGLLRIDENLHTTLQSEKLQFAVIFQMERRSQRRSQPFLFSWKEIDEASDLDRLRLVLSTLPDESLVSYLEQRRGRGRNDYPIRPIWNAVIAGIVFQHPSAAALLREVRRNGELRQLCGFNPFGGEKSAPSDDAMERFLKLLVEHGGMLTDMFHQLIDELKKELPDLGMKTAVDSKAIPSFGNPVRDEEKLKNSDGRRDTDADWGKKTYRGETTEGSPWVKVKSWFGYKLHLLVDSLYELPLGYQVTKASTNDNPTLLPLVRECKQRHPDLMARAQECAADKGYDSADNNRDLYDNYGIYPIIDMRKMWKEEKKKSRPLIENKADVFTYDESGQVYCHCPTERTSQSEKRGLVFVGFEKGRDTLKYRCPAVYYGFECIGQQECERNTKVASYGRTVRVSLNRDRRIFTPIARHTYKWQKAYARRTAVERVNSRIDQVLGFEHHNIRGQKKMKVRLSLALVVMLSMAAGRIQMGQYDTLRSLTAPVEAAA